MRFRPFQVLLVSLLACAPVMAATVSIDGNGDGTVGVTVTAESAVNIVALALDIDVTAGGIVTDVSIDTPCFNIFPDAAYVLGGSYNYGEGTPVADKTFPGEISLPQNSFTLCAGCLNGPSTPGADGAPSVQFRLTFDQYSSFCISENAIRGGIVLTDGTGEDITNGTDGVVCGDSTPPCESCVSCTASFYADWVAFGSPDCWCYARNCLGDADGLQQGSVKTGFVNVSTNDLTILANAWQIKEPPAGPGLGYPGICADFDRSAQGSIKTGFVRVSTNDLTILANNWQIKEPPAGPGIGDCAEINYNYFLGE